MGEVDLVNRDPNSINPTLGAHFEEVLAEPDGIHSIDCLWRNGYMCFNGGKSCCYKFMSTICGLCLALCWGCVFACVAFEHIWCITPCVKCFDLNCDCARRFWKSIVDCCCGPLCETYGLMFSRIRVTNLTA